MNNKKRTETSQQENAPWFAQCKVKCKNNICYRFATVTNIAPNIVYTKRAK